MTAMTVNIWFTPHKNLVEKVKLTKLPMACLIASTTHQDKEWSIENLLENERDPRSGPMNDQDHSLSFSFLQNFL
jgi:hypothetical protein